MDEAEPVHVCSAARWRSATGDENRDQPARLTGNARQELVRKVLDVGHRERDEAVLLEKVKDGRAKELKDEADVVFVVKHLGQVDAFAAKARQDEHQPRAGSNAGGEWRPGTDFSL